MERHGEHVLFLVHLGRVGNVILRDLVAERQVPVHRGDQRIQVIDVVAQGVQAADQAAHAGTHDHVDGNLLLLQITDHAHVRSPLGPASAEHQGHRRPMLGPADPVQFLPHFFKCHSIPFRIHTGRGELRAGTQGQQSQDCGSHPFQSLPIHRS